jgi:hypothetical protein
MIKPLGGGENAERKALRSSFQSRLAQDDKFEACLRLAIAH